MKKEKMTYEAAYAELQQIVSALQNDSVSIDDLSEKVKRAAELVAFCQEKLRTIETELA
jgi:exodeoxyribonuclease VII small subunit